MKKLVYFLPSFMFATVALTANAQDLGYIDSVFNQISDLVTDILLPLLFALALLFFVWGVIKFFIMGADDEGNRETGRKYMLYSILGLVAIVAVWGIVNVVANIFGVTPGTNAPTAPGIPGASS